MTKVRKDVVQRPRLAALINHDGWTEKVLEAIRAAEQYAYDRTSHPFTTLSDRGLIGWLNSIMNLGELLQRDGWTYNREVQPSYNAPNTLVPGGARMFCIHGRREGDVIRTAKRGESTRGRANHNHQQLALFDLDTELGPIKPKSGGPWHFCLVSETNGGVLDVHLALVNGVSDSGTSLFSAELATLNKVSIQLTAPSAFPAAKDLPEAETVEINVEERGTG
jgi:hypothetical protein